MAKSTDQENHHRRLENETNARFRVRVTSRFIALSLLSCVLVAFAIGKTARVLLIVNPQKEYLKRYLLTQDLIITGGGKNSQLKLPNPVLQKGKHVPQTTYTARHFDTAKSATMNSRWVVTEDFYPECAKPAIDATKVLQGEENEEAHRPQGEHLLIDIENVDSTFLNSEERLASAMVELVRECGLTLLSYHCHGLTPMGVTCAGVLLESHVSLHTWPSEGVITLDLFTCGPLSLLPMVPLAEKLFAVPSESSSGDVSRPKMIWAQKTRGFDDDISLSDALELVDLSEFPIGTMADYKQEILSTTTEFQRVDIYDVLRPHFQDLEAYRRSLSNDDSYEATHPDQFAPDRIVYLDGILQSRRSGDAAYHEALVHPAIFAHHNPRRVAIIGGGEGATLREVLKHKTVEKVVMIDIDEEFVGLAQEFLPSWNDCSILIGSTPSCFDDPRVDLYCEDAFKWFIDRFSEANDEINEQPFDVIIMDALDPQIQRDFVITLYDGGPFLRSLPNAIGSGGVFIAQVGRAPRIIFPSEEYSLNRNRFNFLRCLVDLGFESIVDYEEAGSGFGEPWQFVVAFKSFDSRAAWFAQSSSVNLKMRERLIPTLNRDSPLRYFDGAKMLSYMFPSKASEVVFCHREPKPSGCGIGHGFDLERRNLPLSILEVKPSSLGENAGRGVFAKVNIPQNSYVGLERLVYSVYISPNTHDIVVAMEDYLFPNASWWRGETIIHAYGYGHWFNRHGRFEVLVDSTFQCFINHGCDGSSNVGHYLNISEGQADPDVVPDELIFRFLGKENVYNPIRERQVHFYSSAVPCRDIIGGEELFDNYLGSIRPEMWASDVNDLKQVCHSVDDAIGSG